MAQPRFRTAALVLCFSLAIAATLFFGYRAGHTARHIRSPNEPIRSWMSVPFIAHTYHAREQVLFEAIRVAPDPHDHRPIGDIARAEKVPVTDLIRDLRKAVGDARETGKAP